MARAAHDIGITRRSWLLASLGIPLLARRAPAESPLEITFDGDNIHLSAPGFHFLTGKPLARLKDANTVVFVSQITLFSDDHGTIFRKPVAERLIVSYALWEEKFSATIRGTTTRTMPHLLSAGQTETWCLENLAVSALGIAPDRPFWLRFDLRSANSKDLSKLLGDEGISFSGLLEFFSRKSTPDDPSWRMERGPLRLMDLPRTLTQERRARGG